MKLMWMVGAEGEFIATDPLGEETSMFMDVHRNFARMHGDVRLDADSLEALGRSLIEGAQIIRDRERRERNVDAAFRRALGL